MAEHDFPRASRPLPKLRTKTGCLTCRGRRKKCDEAKPRCKACQRNWLECRWQSPASKSRLSQGRSQERLSVELYSGNTLTLSPTSTEEIFDGFITNGRASSEGAISVGDGSVSSEATLMKREHSDSETQAVSPTSITSSLVHLPPGITSTDDYDGMQYFISEIGPYMVRTHSHPGFFDHSYMVSLALHNPGLMESFLALSYVHRSAQDKKFYTNAITHYNSAIRTLRPLFNNQSLNGTEDWLLMMMDIFCLIERWNIHSTSRPNVHLTALIKVLKLRYERRGASLFSSQIHTFERAMAESVLYQSVVLSLYKQIDDAIIGDIFDHLQDAYAIDPFPDAPPWSNSPLLGFPPEVYNVIHKVLKLRRSVPLQGRDHENAEELYKDLCGLNLYSNVMTSMQESELELAKMRACCDATQLFLLATKIILLKIMNPGFQAGNACIQSHVEQALAILGPTQSPFFRYDQYLIWPLIVVGLASIHEDDVVIIRDSLQKVWNNTHCGDAKRGLSVLDRVSRSGKSLALDGEAHVHISGLDMLICKDGIF